MDLKQTLTTGCSYLRYIITTNVMPEPMKKVRTSCQKRSENEKPTISEMPYMIQYWTGTNSLA